MTKALYGLQTARTLEHTFTTTWLHKVESRRLCVCQQSAVYIMAYFDDLLVVGDNTTTPQFLQHFELKHTSQLTTTT
eukprot:3534905-Amphidinium_carterae.1